MNVPRVLTWICLPLLLVIASTGCATKKPMVSAWCDPQFSLTKDDKLALSEQIDPTPQNVVLDRSLTAELKREGFNIVSSDQADYVLAGVLDKEFDVHHRPPAAPIYDPITCSGPPIAPHSSYVNSSFGSGIYMPPPQPESEITYLTTREFIRLYLYTNPKTHAGQFRQVWQGNIDAEGSDAAGHEQLLLKTLLSFYGEEFNGRVNLAPEPQASDTQQASTPSSSTP